MKLVDKIYTLKRTVQTAPNRLALTILLWLEKEPSDERILPWPALQAVPEGELRHRIREYKNCRRRGKVA
jgi:hypothetical protein